MDPAARALIELGHRLRDSGYSFVTTTPETHRRVNARAERQGFALAQDLRDVFGWSRPFAPELLPYDMLTLLDAAGELRPDGEVLRSHVRFSSIGASLLVHSAFPTSDHDSVFFGPDTYRFCSLLERRAPRARRAVDIGCGSGAGGLCLQGKAERVVLADVNRRALRFARVNAALAGVDATVVESDVLDDVGGPVDLIVSNPPYLCDARRRIYRDGGGSRGEGLSVRIVRESLDRLEEGGTLILYTGSAVVSGHDTFRESIARVLHASEDVAVAYEELDPDVFGEELSQPGYEDVERIAVVALEVTKTGLARRDGVHHVPRERGNR
jgi:release factor glutamine methyltransferase